MISDSHLCESVQLYTVRIQVFSTGAANHLNNLRPEKKSLATKKLKAELYTARLLF